MTANKPEVKAWKVRDEIFYSKDDAVEASAFHSRHCDLEPLIRLSDYEALQAECEKLRKVADQYSRLIELGEDFQWENIIRVDISDFPSRAAAIDAAMAAKDRP